MSTLALENQLQLELEETPPDTAESNFDYYWMDRVSELLPELARLRRLVIQRDREAGQSWKQIGVTLGMEPSHAEDLAKREMPEAGK